MVPPDTDHDHAQLLLNLLRGRTPLHSSEWQHLEAWALAILQRDDDGGTERMHSRLWKRHVQMLRNRHTPSMVNKLIEAVTKYDAAQSDAASDD